LTRTLSVAGLALTLFTFVDCSQIDRPQVFQLKTRPAPVVERFDPGEHALGLGGRRDGVLYIPPRTKSQAVVPLMVLMHGGGSDKEFFRFTFPLGEELGVAILIIDSRHNTWDAVDSPFGPDVEFIDKALADVFKHLPVDPRRLALGGVSDGGSYALSLGLMNGELFSHVVAFAPGFIATPAPRVGRPAIFVAHGTRDDVLRIDWTSRRFVPRLKADGYDVTYLEFDGPHNVPVDVARAALGWLTRTPEPSAP
jgi:phospholipase/carboxylesterase